MSGSTTSAPERALPARALLLAALLALTACGAREVQVEGQFPAPLMSKLPLTLGVWYEPEFRGHEFFDEAKGRNESDWLVRTGEAQVALWDTLLAGMFEEVIHLDARPDTDGETPAVDAVLIPRVDELQYAIPAQTNVKVYEIWMRYAFELVTREGDSIAGWTMPAYGKTPTAFLQSDEDAVNLAAVVALRDAGAHFATSFPRIPDIARWLETRAAPPAEAQAEADANAEATAAAGGAQ